MNIKSEIFREYDVRGVYPEEINEDVAYRIGVAFSEYLAQNQFFGEIVIGRDVRLSSPALYDAAKKAILDQGRDIIEVGLVTTPRFFFIVAKNQAAGGRMFNASPNPPPYKGVKFVKKEAAPISFSGGIEVIRELAKKDLPRKISPGRSASKDFSAYYLDVLTKSASIGRTLRVCADGSNGAGGALLERLFNKLNITFGSLNFEPDGNFPGHSPNPSLPEALIDLQTQIKNGGFDIGVILDADGDRAVFVDEEGRVVRSDIVAAWLASHLIEKGDSMILDYRSSKVVWETVRKNEGKIILFKAGQNNIKRAMRENTAKFGAELSGHFYFKDFYYADSALMAVVHVLSYLSQVSRPFSEVIAPYQKYFHSGEINFEIENKEKIIAKIQGDYSAGEQVFRDGLTTYFSDWWFNLRPSNTEPLLRLVVEANTKELMAEKRDELIAKIKTQS